MYVSIALISVLARLTVSLVNLVLIMSSHNFKIPSLHNVKNSIYRRDQTDSCQKYCHL